MIFPFFKDNLNYIRCKYLMHFLDLYGIAPQGGPISIWSQLRLRESKSDQHIEYNSIWKTPTLGV